MSAPEAVSKVSGYHHVNQYHFSNDESLTDYGRKLVEDINNEILVYHWDNSDPMVDYFSCAFYYGIRIGKWDKPFQVV